jgi:hypothetical protein
MCVVSSEENEVTEADKTVTSEITTPPYFAVVTGEGHEITQGHGAVGIIIW